MSRSVYIDDYEQWSLIRWRAAVKSGLRGKRGQVQRDDDRTAIAENIVRIISPHIRAIYGPESWATIDVFDLVNI